MKETSNFREYDAAEFLDSDELIATYLKEVFSEGTESEIKIALSNVARAKNMTDLANKMGIKREDLFKFLSEDENLETTNVQKFLHAIGMPLNVFPVIL